MAWSNLSDRYDSAMANAQLDQCIITLNHYLRHIRHNKDIETADAFHKKIYRLEAQARKVWKETKAEKDDERVKNTL